MWCDVTQQRPFLMGLLHRIALLASGVGRVLECICVGLFQYGKNSHQ